MPNKSVVLLSAGLDSSFNLFQAARETEVALAITFNYGQKAASREISQSQKLTRLLKIPHKIIELPWFSEFTSTALVDAKASIPKSNQVEIESLQTSKGTAKAVWVPNRNGILLNIAAGYAEGLGAHWVIPGFNKEEAETFPDNSDEYMKALDHSFSFSTQSHVKVKCYSQHLSKIEIVRQAQALDVPFGELWPCYEAGSSWCGECESCKRFNRALKANGVTV